MRRINFINIEEVGDEPVEPFQLVLNGRDQLASRPRRARRLLKSWRSEPPR
jgi:hypothetical protein